MKILEKALAWKAQAMTAVEPSADHDNEGSLAKKRRAV